MGLKNILSGGIEGVLNSANKIIDNVVTNDEERMKLKNQLKNAARDHELSMAQEISARHKADMMSDSWLSKNIRPMVLVWCLAVVTLFAVTDGNIGGFVIDPAYLDIIRPTLMAAIAFYFGSRGMEKWKAMSDAKDLQKHVETERTKREQPKTK